ncbi:hypothetical protein MW887_008826 [Aspergillus wentii]|nr:hypothetical protein MW887_008826 [Aspergillus wentii]
MTEISTALSTIKEDQLPLVHKILCWLSYSTRPLSIAEIKDLATTTTKNQNHDQTKLDILSLLPSSAVKITQSTTSPDEQHQQVQLESSSSPALRNYLSASGLEKKQAHTTIATDCLLYLPDFAVPYVSTPEKVESAALLRYATNYWPVHVKLGDQIEELHALVMRLFSSETEYLNWTAFLDGYTPFTGDGERKTPKPIYYASSFGLIKEVKRLLDDGASVNENETGGPTTALGVAALSGHCDVMALLISHGADVNSPGGDLGPALNLAASGGHVDAVELLLLNGAVRK